MAINGDNIKRFMAAQERAKKLIDMDVKGGFSKYKNKAIQQAEMTLNENLEQQFVQEKPQQTQNMTMNLTNEQISKTNSKLPKEILESFKNKSIDTSPLGYGVTSSILDEVNYRTNGKLYNEQETKIPTVQTKQINENIHINTPTNNQNIDYSMIKMIVEDCMKKYVGTVKKTILNESKKNNVGELQAMKIGDKFSFITKNGDLYEAELKFIKNLNNKKG